jgi:hypothetical protein
MTIVLLRDVSRVAVGTATHLVEASFPFLGYMLWSLYPSTFGLAIPSAFGQLNSAETL